MRVDIPVGLQLLFEISLSAIEEDSTGGLVTEVFDDSGKVGADVILLHGCPQSFMLKPGEGLLELYEGMVMLELEVFLT